MSIAGNVKNSYPIIYRVYHTGEILEKVRFITTSFTSSRYNRYDLGLQLWPKSYFRGHSMAIMSCGFADIIDRDPDERYATEHFYDRQFAAEYAQNSDQCSEFRKGNDEVRAARLAVTKSSQ